jgi:hypothetical protein
VITENTLYVPKTPNTTNTVTDTYETRLGDCMLAMEGKDRLKTRPVSSTFPPIEEPEMRDSRIEETSEAAAQ